MAPFSSQYGVEKVVNTWFPDHGLFLEIGAWDGFRLSQTAWLEENGWRGWCVEPAPQNFGLRKCVLIKKAVVFDPSAQRKFILVGEDQKIGGDVSYFSGFRDNLNVHWDLISDQCTWEPIAVEPITPNELFRNWHMPHFIEFLSVDTEGSELEIFQGIDFNSQSFGLITYEHNGDMNKREAIDKILTRHNYVMLYPELSKEDDIYINYAYTRSRWHKKG